MNSEQLKKSTASSSPQTLMKPHECTVDGCSAKFSRPHKLEAHIRKHKGERPFKCNFPDCTKTYTNSSHLKRHKVTAHENINDNHEYLCTERGCLLVFANKYSLQKHITRHHREETYPFKCSNCPEKFKKKKHFCEHFNLAHNNIPFKCESCQIGFVSIIQYNKHKSNHKTFTCDCEKTFDRWSKFCEHRRTDCPLKKIEHPCVICKKTFKTKRNLKAHSLKVHVTESQTENHKCPYLDCKRSYQYKRNLNYHIAFYHEKSMKDMKIKCTHSECDIVFKAERYLYRHLKLIHREKIKIQKPKKPRKDRGKKKFCMAAYLSGIKLNRNEHLGIIQSTPSRNVIDLTSLKISVPNSENNSMRNHVSQALKLGSMSGTIRIPRVENHLQGKMLIVVVTQEAIYKPSSVGIVQTVETGKVFGHKDTDNNQDQIQKSVSGEVIIGIDEETERMLLGVGDTDDSEDIVMPYSGQAVAAEVDYKTEERVLGSSIDNTHSTLLKLILSPSQCIEEETEKILLDGSDTENSLDVIVEIDEETEKLLLGDNGDSQDLVLKEVLIPVKLVSLEIEKEVNGCCSSDGDKEPDPVPELVSSASDQFEIDINEETERALVDNDAGDDNVLLVDTVNETLPQYVKVLEVQPVEGLEMNVNIADTHFITISTEPLSTTGEELNTNSVNSDHVQCDILV